MKFIPVSEVKEGLRFQTRKGGMVRVATADAKQVDDGSYVIEATIPEHEGSKSVIEAESWVEVIVAED
jgi:hypothetical protein